MSRFKFLTKILLYLMLISPLAAYAYTVWLKLPKTISFFFTFIVFALGFVYIFYKKKYFVPLFAKYLLVFAIYRIGWRFLLETDKYFLTEIYYYIQDLAIYFIIIIIYNTRFDDKFIKRSIIIIKLTIVMAALVSVIQVFKMNFFNENIFFLKDYEITTNLYLFRRNSIFGFIDPNAPGLAFIPLLSVLIGFMLYNKNKTYPIYLIFGGIVAMLTNGRYIMIGFLLISFQIFIFKKTNIKSLIKYAFLVIFGFIFFTYLLSHLGYNFQEWYNQRLLSEGDIQGTTRFKAIGNFIIFFPQKPIFGFGEMTKEIVTASEAVGSSHIHVGYLSHLVMYGIVGCFFLFRYWFLLAKHLYKTAKITNYWGSFFAFLMFLWSFSTMSQSSIFYYGLIFSLVFDKYFCDKRYNELLQIRLKAASSHFVSNPLLQ